MSGNNIFKTDLKYGKKYEHLAHTMLKEKFNLLIVDEPKGNFKYYDVAMYDQFNKKYISFEIKTTRFEYSTIFIECCNKNNEPSGIEVSTADYYIFVDVSNDEKNINYYIIKTDVLKQKILKKYIKKIRPNKWGTARGFVVKKTSIIGASSLLL
jgi:hypothetical protein